MGHFNSLFIQSHKSIVHINAKVHYWPQKSLSALPRYLCMWFAWFIWFTCSAQTEQLTFTSFADTISPTNVAYLISFRMGGGVLNPNMWTLKSSLLKTLSSPCSSSSSSSLWIIKQLIMLKVSLFCLRVYTSTAIFINIKRSKSSPCKGWRLRIVVFFDEEHGSS